ncbi:MAG: glycoside hydrolase family 95 protein [Tannerellaceae bacterium]|nr:glycoside hydrolase family 95 protein [Tannerellaceae bacterium]
MKRTFYSLLVCLALCACSTDETKVAVNQLPMTWRYDVPAAKFWEALPIGTGRFGAMVPGAIGHESLAFNDETLWTGGPYNSNNPNGPEVLKKVREYAFAHKWDEATNEAKNLIGYPPHVQFYQAMARLNTEWEGQEFADVSGYSRCLNMDSAIVDVDYQLGGVNYSRRIFASYPDQVIVMRFTADKKGMINISNWFTSLQNAVTRVENDIVIMEGSTIAEKENEIILPPQMKWQARLKVIPEGGTLTADGDRLVLKNADAVTLILAGATNWVAWNDVSADAVQRCSDYISNATKYSYADLLKRHLDDYCPQFASCKINLGADPNPAQSTTQAMDAIRNGAFDPAYEARYFQYGRYLMFAAARENTLAFNNHNMWLDDLDGRWRGRWTLNINIQECYWPVENTNMTRINESLLLFVENLAQSGARTAKEVYGCRGWCSHHGTDVWFNSAFTDIHPHYGLFPVSGVWLMQQLYEHYVYDPDVEYLKRIYPLLKGATEFCADFLVESPEGFLVTCPATSPENSFKDEKDNWVSVSYGSAGDIQLVRRLLRDFIDAAQTLNTDAELCNQAQDIIKRLPPHKIGSFGQLQEWFFDFKESEVTHRHLTNLIAFYPDDDISLRKTPELARAVKTVLDRRGGTVNMGWSGAWKINQHARLEEGDEAYAILHKMLTDVSIHPAAEDSQITPSFEGNQAIQGITAGITELLMQSHSGELSLLPALPSQWKSGAISGIRARGGIELDIEWDNNALTKAVIRAKYDKTCTLRTKTPVKVFSGRTEIAVKTIESGLIEFNMQAGKKYTIL